MGAEPELGVPGERLRTVAGAIQILFAAETFSGYL